ncbi:MAG: esterase family protein [Anaerolineales bacterium]|nr:esterase family protein [Anaerolineales bacterium]
MMSRIKYGVFNNPSDFNAQKRIQPQTQISLKHLSLFLLLCLLITACTPAAAPNTATALPPTEPSLTITLTPVTLTPTLTPSITPTQTVTPTLTPLACWGESGRNETGEIDAESLRQPLEYLVHLPPCYDHQSERSYPVLYLIHGQSYDQFQWQRLGASEVMDELSASGEITPFIIVMPRDRLWEPPNIDLFGQVVVEELIPYIDDHYRTIPVREFRAIGGLSRGAGWSVHLGIMEWELFGALGAHSLAAFDIDAMHLRQWLKEIPVESLPRIYVDIGDKDRPNIMRSALWFEEMLTDENIPHVWNLYQGYHSEEYWSAHIEEYIRWYAEDW